MTKAEFITNPNPRGALIVCDTLFYLLEYEYLSDEMHFLIIYHVQIYICSNCEKKESLQLA